MERKMKETPVNTKDENGRSSTELSYDPQIDFYKFLDEAKNHATSEKLESEAPSFANRMTVDHKSKRSWKNSLFFWRKYQKKEVDSHDRRTKEASSECRNSRKAFAVSGPMVRSKDRVGIGQQRGGWPGSGPLAGWFTPTRAEETVLPYISLNQQNNPSTVQAFGPIYSVS